jgi:uncharacterized protein (DUF885 family)
MLDLLRAAAALSLFSTTMGLAQEPPTLDQMAAEYRAQTIADDPVLTYFSGLPPSHNDRFADRGAGALNASDAWKRVMLRKLEATETAALTDQQRALRAVLLEQLSSDLRLRVCRGELWNVNHFTGWQALLVPVAEGQPVATTKDRAEALARWSSLPAFVAVEIANLDRGLAEHYAAPKSVVRRVIAQLDSLLPANGAASPLLSPATRSEDPEFKGRFAGVVDEDVVPALRQYRNYLETVYLPRARDGVAVTELPDGRACYQAMLRANTTLDRTPEQVYALGERAVEENLSAIRAIGERRFGTTDVLEIVDRLKADPANHFESAQDLLSFSRAVVAKAKIRTATIISALPRQDVVVEPNRSGDEAAGVSSHYDINGDAAEPATYQLQMGPWKTQTKGEATIVAVHEAWPGHHLQIAYAREQQPSRLLGDLVMNSAYVEGWARYAEGLAEDVGLYEGDDARVLRRIWPARGMVVDPGLHALGWSRQRAIAYLVSTGRFDDARADEMVDRIAVLPGQLTSYDSGALEILSLRREAEAALGPVFDLKGFNAAILAPGVVPLAELRRHVGAWIASRQGHRKD